MSAQGPLKDTRSLFESGEAQTVGGTEELPPEAIPLEDYRAWLKSFGLVTFRCQSARVDPVAQFLSAYHGIAYQVGRWSVVKVSESRFGRPVALPPVMLLPKWVSDHVRAYDKFYSLTGREVLRLLDRQLEESRNGSATIR